MASFLFAIQPSMGHLNPMLSIANQMRSAGHEVTFLCAGPKRIETIIRDNKFPVFNVRPSLTFLGFLFLPLFSGYLETVVALKLFFSGLTHYAQTTSRILKKTGAQVLVSDFAFPGAGLAAESVNIPYVIIYHAGLGFKGPGIPPFGSGLPIGKDWGLKGKVYGFLSNLLENDLTGKLNKARKRLKLPGKERITPLYLSSPWLNLVLTTQASEAPRYELPETTFYIGPCFSGRQGNDSKDFPFSSLSPHKLKIYLSLGTFFNNKPGVFRKIINAFSDSPYELIVSAGGAFKKLSSQSFPANILLFERVPQLDMLTQVNAVISHGGNNTVNETLAAGKPLLVMPVGGEQGDNASRVEYLGVGLRADIKRFSSREILNKIKRLIEEESFIQRAKEVASHLAMTRGPVTATRFIEYVADNRRPVLRPAGYPLTVIHESAPPWKAHVAD